MGCRASTEERVPPLPGTPSESIHPQDPGALVVPAAHQASQQPVWECGVSVSFLDNFKNQVPESCTTQDVVTQFIIPHTALHDNCRYVDTLEAGITTAKPAFFISHRWGSLFHETVGLVVECAKNYKKSLTEQHREAPLEVFVWFDIFAMCQHPSSSLQQDDLANLHLALKAATSTWYEMWLTINHKGPSALVVMDWLASKHKIQGMWASLNVNTAECVKPTDTERILAEIKGSPTPPDTLNRELRTIMQRKLHPGITLQGIADFCSEMPQGSDLHKCYQSILWKTSQSAYTDLMPVEQVGIPSIYVAHSWRVGIQTFVDSLSSHFNGDFSVCLYVAVFALNWHNEYDHVKPDTIKMCSGTLLLLDARGQWLGRIYLLEEIWLTLRAHGLEGLHIKVIGEVDNEAMSAAIDQVDFRTAKSNGVGGQQSVMAALSEATDGKIDDASVAVQAALRTKFGF